MKTIIIEDQSSNYQRILDLLRTFPELVVADIGPTRSSEAAKQAITSNCPDLILLDNNLSDAQGWQEEAEGLEVGLFAKQFNPLVTIVSISDLKIPNSGHHIQLLEYYYEHGLELFYCAGKGDYEIALAVKQIIIKDRKCQDNGLAWPKMSELVQPSSFYEPNYTADTFCFMVLENWWPICTAKLWNIQKLSTFQPDLKAYLELIDHVYAHKQKKIITFTIMAANPQELAVYIELFFKNFGYLAKQIDVYVDNIDETRNQMPQRIIELYQNK